MQNSISAYLTDTLQKIRPHSMDAILQTIHPESEEKLKKLLANGLLDILQKDETANIINRVLAKQIDRLLSAPIGKISDHISEEQIESAGEKLPKRLFPPPKKNFPKRSKNLTSAASCAKKLTIIRSKNSNHSSCPSPKNICEPSNFSARCSVSSSESCRRRFPIGHLQNNSELKLFFRRLPFYEVIFRGGK